MEYLSHIDHKITAAAIPYGESMKDMKLSIDRNSIKIKGVGLIGYART
ncbi:MAG TPA: hypothetical protein VIS94_07530 [Desulfomonilia bacterium]